MYTKSPSGQIDRASSEIQMNGHILSINSRLTSNTINCTLEFPNPSTRTQQKNYFSDKWPQSTIYYSATVHGSGWKTKENKVCCLVHGAARYPPLCDPFGRYSLKISTLTAVTLTMRTAIKNCHKTHRVLIMHRYTIFWLQNVPNVNRYETKLLFFED